MNEEREMVRHQRSGRPDRKLAERMLLRLVLAGIFMPGVLAAAALAQASSSDQQEKQPTASDQQDRQAPTADEQENPLLSKKQDQMLDGQSGFLGDLYARLGPDHGNKDWLVYIPDPSVLSRDNAFLVEPVKVMLAPQVQKKDVPQEDLDKLAQTLQNDMRDELTKGHYKVVDQPGPGVSALRLAITNVEPNGGKTNAVVSGSEAVATHAVAPGAGLLVPRLKVGKVSVEGELVDSQSGKVEMAFMTAKSGRRFFSGLKAFEKWGDIDAAFKGWSKNFRERLDKAHRQNF